MEGQLGSSRSTKSSHKDSAGAGSSQSQSSSSDKVERLFGIEMTMSRPETSELTRQVVPKSCVLHFEKSPMKVRYGQNQYIYDETGVEYLDCVNCVAHVGHGHPTVVKAGTEAMGRVGSVSGYDETSVIEHYINTLRTTLPVVFDTFLFVSSVSEANDLALRLAQMHTGGTEVVGVDRSFHDSGTLPSAISLRTTQSPSQVPDWVHVLPCPDLYRGKYKDDDSEAVDKYCNEAQALIQYIVMEKKQKIACLILESIMSTAGVVIPPSNWIKTVYDEIHNAGGLVISDEVQTGMGRCGTSWWAFQYYEDLVPDIITIGKPLGNGHPMAIVATSNQIAASLGPAQLKLYACDNVTAAIGSAVIKVIRQENLLQNARNVGSFLREGLKGLANSYRHIGDVRGVGLMVAVEIVQNQQNRKPAKDIAERISYMMKEHKIILGNDGIHKNILVIVPPMSFTCENSHRLISTLAKILEAIDAQDCQPGSSKSSRNFEFPAPEDPSQQLTTSIFEDCEKMSYEDFRVEMDKPSHYTEMD